MKLLFFILFTRQILFSAQSNKVTLHIKRILRSYFLNGVFIPFGMAQVENKMRDFTDTMNPGEVIKFRYQATSSRSAFQAILTF